MNQKSLGLSYKIPHNWNVGGIEPEKKYPNTMSTLNVATDYSVSMYIKSSKEDDAIALVNQSLWTYTFMKGEDQVEVKTANFTFNKVVSHWQEDEKEQVWRYTVSAEDGRHYILYFWGKATALEERATLIQEILDSTKWLDSATK